MLSLGWFRAMAMLGAVGSREGPPWRSWGLLAPPAATEEVSSCRPTLTPSLGGLEEGVTGAQGQGGTSPAVGPWAVLNLICQGKAGAGGPQQPRDAPQGGS